MSARRGAVPQEHGPQERSPRAAAQGAGNGWRGGWLALLPVVPPLSALAFAQLGRAREFGRAARLVLAFFALTQLLAALLAPQPLPSLALAAFRTLFLCALLATGWQLRAPFALRPLLIGLAAVYLTALAASWWLRGDLLHGRLIHPYYTTVSLGLAATLGLWLLLAWRGGPAWARWLLGALAAATLALSGSRGAVLALLVGVLCAALAGTRGTARLLAAGGALLLAGLLAGWLPDNLAGGNPAGKTAGSSLPAALEHLSQLGLNGRDVYWDEVLGTLQARPWGGVGPYQLGFFARTPQARCWQPIDASVRGCPAWLTPLQKVSWVAHNAALHSLGESGLIGTAGLFALLGLIGFGAWRSQNPLLLAIFGGFGAMNLVDNVTAVPSLHLAEVFWMAGGMALRALPQAAPLSLTLGRASLWGGALLLALTAPLGLPTWLATQTGLISRPNVQLLALDAPRQLVTGGPNTIFLGLKLTAGTYRLRLRVCARTCDVAAQRQIVSDGQWWGGVTAPQLAPGTRLELQLLPGENVPWSARPLGTYRWRVGGK